MRIVPVAVIALALALGVAVPERPATAGELIPGGWLMPPRIPQVAPAPIAPEPPRAPPPVVRKAPPQPPRPMSQPPARRTAPSDGKVQF